MREFDRGRYRGPEGELFIRVQMSDDKRYLDVEIMDYTNNGRTERLSYICTTMPPIEIIREAVPQ